MSGCSNWADNNSANNNFVITISWHIKNPGIFDRCATKDGGGVEGSEASEGRSPLLFLKTENSVLNFEKKALIVSILSLNLPFKM